MLFAALYIAQHALAAPLVLHTNDDPGAVRSLVLKHAELRVGEFTVTHIDDFIAAQVPRWQGRGSLTACDGPAVDAATLTAQVDRAEESLLYQDLKEAATLLATTQSQLPCLRQPVPTALGSRVGLLQGVLATESEEGAAFEFFSYASRFEADLEWDEQFGIDGARLFRAAKLELSSAEPVSVSIVPRPGEGDTIHVNGRAVDASAGGILLPVGESIVQVQTPAGMAGFQAIAEPKSTPDLLLPQLMSKDMFSTVDTDAGREALSRVISMTVDNGTPVYVADEARLWQTASGFPGWVNLTSDATVPVAPAARVRPAAWISASVTAAVAAGSVAALIRGASAAEERTRANWRFVAAAETGGGAAADREHAAANAARVRANSSYAIAAAGAAATVVGIVVTVPLFNAGGQP